MKNRIFKIMGVSLALVLVFSLGAVFMPANTVDEAEAGTLAWSTVGIPSATSNVLVGNAEDLGPVAISPDFANDNTVFAVVNDATAWPATAAPLVYKSTDGGHTWVAATANVGVAGDFAIAMECSPEYATDSTVFVVTQTPLGGAGTGRVLRSTNGGSTFGQLGVVDLVGTEVITSFDVAPDYDGTGVLVVGIADGLDATVPATAAECVQIWGDGGVLNWADYGPAAAVDISAVKFSPNYAIDTTILVVSAVAIGTPLLRDIVGGTWDQISATGIDIGATGIDDFAYDALAGDSLLAADIALPSDYNGTVATLRRAYVSIVSDAAGAATLTNVYRITGTATGTEIATATVSGTVKITGIEYRGTYAEGTLMGALWEATPGGAADVYRTTNPTDAATSVVWYNCAGNANKPTGGALATANTTAWIAMSVDYENDSTVIVGTQGDDSAFGASTDGATNFNERGLIECASPLTNLMDVQLSPDYANDSTMFLTTNLTAASANDVQVFVTTNGATYWDRCFVENWTTPCGVVALSDEFATDSTVYVGDQTGNDIYYSANTGQSWSARTCGVTIQTIAATDATTVYVGEDVAGRVAKSNNSGWTWPASIRKSTGNTAPIYSLVAEESTIIAGGNGGTVRRSDDGGATWSKVGATLSGALDVWVAYDSGNDIVYAGDGGAATGQMYRSEASGSWVPLTMPALTNDAYDIDDVGVIAATSAGAGLALAADGTIYAVDPTAYLAVANAPYKDSIWRCIAPTTAEPTPGTTWERVGGWTSTATDNAMHLTSVSGGSNILVMLGDTDNSGSAEVMRMYTDTLSAGIAPPTLDFPADGSALSTTYCVFGIKAIANVTQYEIRWATDSTLTSRYTQLFIEAPQVQVGGTVTEGYTIYWKARATEPFLSPWSEVWTCHTALVSEVDAPRLLSPGETAGSTVDVPINPVLNWESWKYASGYEFQLAKDADMTDFIADLSGANALGNVTSWKCTTTLAYSTTYFWRVRAILGTATTYSDWSNIIGFTTMAKPVEPTPPVIIEPAPPAPAPVEPTTPSYVWAIIGIGAVLVIVVVVLIVRTRRAV